MLKEAAFNLDGKAADYTAYAYAGRTEQACAA
jgi:hypothetical protein